MYALQDFARSFRNRPELARVGERINKSRSDGFYDACRDYRLRLLVVCYFRGTTVLQVTKAYVRAMVPGIGQSGLAQIVAYNDRRRKKPLAVLCDYVDGATLRALDEDARSAIPPSHYAGVLETFQIMQGLGLGIESGAARNIMHNADGFVVADYEFDPTQTLTEKVVTFASAGMLLENTHYYDDPVPDYGLLYRDVCAEVLGGDMAAAIEAEWQRS